VLDLHPETSSFSVEAGPSSEAERSFLLEISCHPALSRDDFFMFE
jgi:hypothetical protein